MWRGRGDSDNWIYGRKEESNYAFGDTSGRDDPPRTAPVREKVSGLFP